MIVASCNQNPVWFVVKAGAVTADHCGVRRGLRNLGVRVPRTLVISADLLTKPGAERQEDVTMSVEHHSKSSA